jgi:Domain of unknown function (DUF222)
MFERSGGWSQAQVIAHFDEVAARYELRTTTPESRSWVQRVAAAARAENRAAAAQLVAIGELFAYRLAQSSETEEWAIDTMEAVAAEVGAGLRISQGMAASRIRYARAMRERLPKTAAVFSGGDLDYRAFQTIVYRTDLIVDAQVLARVDAVVAASVTRWPSLTHARLSGKVDAVVAQVDADAVRRRKKYQSDREIFNRPRPGRDFPHRRQPVQHRCPRPRSALSAVAATVCAHDPRTAAQRRADALRALAAGADRLGCRCARPDCAAGVRPAASPVVLHVIAGHDTPPGHGDGAAAGWEVGADGLITPELLAELA